MNVFGWKAKTLMLAGGLLVSSVQADPVALSDSELDRVVAGYSMVSINATANATGPRAKTRVYTRTYAREFYRSIRGRDGERTFQWDLAYGFGYAFASGSQGAAVQLGATSAAAGTNTAKAISSVGTRSVGSYASGVGRAFARSTSGRN